MILRDGNKKEFGKESQLAADCFIRYRYFAKTAIIECHCEAEARSRGNLQQVAHPLIYGVLPFQGRCLIGQRGANSEFPSKYKMHIRILL
ncbi:hypothetical protein DLK05_16460 [Ancylomarina longa]|uniref:Uncharacterized protein n=1 Tax=Ancylomarina longa TaxID=2487017 RepID=A0A434AEL6_9BACT|nr:hypothetical protein DLK05_16460 [Ancylomarina longa]